MAKASGISETIGRLVEPENRNIRPDILENYHKDIRGPTFNLKLLRALGVFLCLAYSLGNHCSCRTQQLKVMSTAGIEDYTKGQA